MTKLMMKAIKFSEALQGFKLYRNISREFFLQRLRFPDCENMILNTDTAYLEAKAFVVFSVPIFTIILFHNIQFLGLQTQAPVGY
jgi:hypothetical protein